MIRISSRSQGINAGRIGEIHEIIEFKEYIFFANSLEILKATGLPRAPTLETGKLPVPGAGSGSADPLS